MQCCILLCTFFMTPGLYSKVDVLYVYVLIKNGICHFSLQICGGNVHQKSIFLSRFFLIGTLLYSNIVHFMHTSLIHFYVYFSKITIDVHFSEMKIILKYMEKCEFDTAILSRLCLVWVQSLKSYIHIPSLK